jgi:GNAT superfamily N-acetyltransferase
MAEYPFVMIRKATTEDQSRITQVRNAVRENCLSPSNASRVADTARWIYEHGTFWVWEQDGAVQGFAVADVRDGTIFGLFVHPDYEGRGIAQALLPLACEDLRMAGHAVAKLTTDPGTRAERFYRRNGWTDTSRREKGEIVFARALKRGS